MILAGDIGGTNTRLAFFEGTPDSLRATQIEIFPSAQFAGPAEIVRKFLDTHQVRPEAAAFGLPGAVVHGRVETTNLPWVVDAGHMASHLSLPQVLLINDLYANAHGIAVLAESDFVVLNPGISQPTGNRALISAGTGLGEAGLFADTFGAYHPFPSEGGHTDFGPRDDLEMELWKYLHGRFGHVSYERILSGPGLHNVYEFLRDTGRGQEPAWLKEQISKGDPAAAISKSGMDGTSEICTQALDIFVSLYGSEAGNLTLKLLATGGTYIGGGIAPKIISKLKGTSFMESFITKGRLGAVLKDIPVRVITNDKTALFGAGRVAALSLAKQAQPV